MVDLSLLLPTRKRRALVERLLQSLSETSSKPECLEVVLYLDSDDKESQLISHPSFSLIPIVGDPGQSMGRMNGQCYNASHGRYIMLINDDALFRSRSWDARVIAAFASFPDGVALVYGNDLDQGKSVPTFPILSRTVCDIVGGVCPEGYQNLHIESHIFDVFRQLKRLGHNRVVYLDDVIIEHMHHSLGKGEADQTSIKKNQRGDDVLFISLDDERRSQAELLAQYIKSQTLQAEDWLDQSSAAQEQARRGSIQWFKGVVHRVSHLHAAFKKERV